MADRAKDSRDGVGRKYDPEFEDDAMSDDEAPTHPVAAMQEAFEESIQEAADGEEDTKTPTEVNAEGRRRELLDQPTYDASWTTRWKQRPNARCHPIVKLMSQIIFGLHLLHQRQAKSDAEVVKILQVHVDEIDAFLEKTTEDFDLAMKDIDERISFLKLPMTHLEVFDVMLDDKKFRTQLIEGNDKIEKIIERTAKAMNAALLDVQKAVNTTQQLAEYLDSVQDDWPHETPDQSAIFVAMKGNEEGWRACLRDLQGKGHQLGVALVQLGTVVGEMSKLAGAASRRNASQNSTPQSPTIPGASYSRHGHRGSQDGRGSLENSDKPLPKEPDTVGAAVRATIPKAHSTVMSDKKLKPKKIVTPSKPKKSNSILGQSKSTKTGKRQPMQPREPTSPKTSQTKDLADFMKNSKPPTTSTAPHASTSRTARPAPVAAYAPEQGRPQSPPTQHYQPAQPQAQAQSHSPPQRYYTPSQHRQPSPPPQNPKQQARVSPNFTSQLPSQQQVYNPPAPHQWAPSRPPVSTVPPNPPTMQASNTMPAPAPVQAPAAAHMQATILNPGQGSFQPHSQAPPPAPAQMPMETPYQPPAPTPAPVQYAPQAAPAIMQYPIPSERPVYNALSAVAHRQTGESKEPAPQEYTVTFERPPRAELDATPFPFPRQVIQMPSHQSFQMSATQVPSTVKSRAQLQLPTDTQLQTSVQAPEKIQTVHNYDPRALHRQMQEKSKMMDQNPAREGPSTHHERQPSDQPHGLSHNISSASGSKVDSAYALSSAKPPSDIASQTSSCAPSRLGLFPDTSITTPPDSSRAGSFSHTSPPQHHTINMSPSAPMDYSQNKSNKFSKFFKRKPKDSHSYVQVSPG
ncbi:hypothetical protein KVT40_002214 [Elsinoe batatas]|uniref:Uncharacterized protein n=1 Tax=Elsinoe batatas TaxID=2601811 RepID=A0A8K0LAN1_9PEZI|nr:hypothetical protein KVT40_002214 [Elsinoe batatas]